MTAGVVVRLERPGTGALASLLTAELPPHARLLVARDGATQQPIGVLALTPGPDDFAELLALEVAPESRRSGVARRLVAAALSYASVQRIRTLRFRVPVQAEAALAAARALGFTEIDGFGAHVGDASGVCFARSVR
ncbi:MULTISPECIES: GNAT family N-acetyltransferase [unclassified Rathayibacter]|uniref:GNAT family N-acetyltransferase n=1 Tax=unclassified Rathayibacter TaxID=2609250 RepID=UPI001052A30E|nr:MULTISPECIES: GNAT family N-acetyltransferase [unclassified Rathayibacter]TCL85434.1 acetyltransferase (GNAT) family protein [Rathayibacter sp. PhB192]TCM31255.1 acetyltransferase (GNAT) family protein [Rathayibacter sp. PhB179]